MSQLPEFNSNPQNQQKHTGNGDNVNLDKIANSYFAEIRGDFKGFQGNVSGGTVNQYIITQQSGEEIRTRKLIPGSPYLGLEKFSVDDKDKFFGRDRWIDELTKYLEKEHILLLLGASGSGKSSLIQAGLIPKWKDQWGSQLFNFTFVPDDDPFESFYGCLLTKYKQSDAKTAQIVQEDTLIKVVEFLKKEDVQWLIYIDQFEELFTRTPQEKRDIFIKSLTQLIDKKYPTVKVVMTMRADFLDKLGPYPALGRIHDYQSRMLTDMEDGDLRLAIAEPAARNGVTFETGLIDKIIADFKQQAGSLPLLQYTLNLLWKNDDINDRVLNSETYEKLGGVTGALQQQANKIYSELDESERKAADQIFLGLIIMEGKEPVSRRAEKSIFEKDKIQKKVLEHLIHNRLLVSKGEAGKITVEVAHETLLRSWPVLQDLIREKEDIIVMSNRLDADAKNWQDAQKASSELWSGSKLGRVVELRKEQALPNLTDLSIAFIEASVTQAERQKNEKIRTARRITAGSLVAVIISSSLGWMAWQKTQQAELNQAESLGRYALSLVKNEHRNLDAFITAIKAAKILQDQHTTNSEVMNALQEALNERIEQNRFSDHQGIVTSVAITPDGKTLVSGSKDGKIRVWDLQKRGEPRIFDDHIKDPRCFVQNHQCSILSVAITPDGKTLVSGSADHNIKVWNLEKEEAPLTLTFTQADGGHTDSVTSVAITPNSETLVSGGNDKKIKVWDLKQGGKLRRTLNADQGWIFSVAITSNGNTLASAGQTGIIKIWNLLEKEGKPRTLIGHQQNQIIYSVTITPDGNTLASGSEDGTITIWNIQTKKNIHTLNNHEKPVYSVAITPDRKTLVSGGEDNTVKIWNIEAETTHTFTNHQGWISSVAITPDGRTLASGSWDKTIKLWNLEKKEEPRTFRIHQKPVSSVAINRDGKILVSGSQKEDTIQVLNLEKNKKLLTLDGSVRSVAITPDAKTLVSGSKKDGTIKVWNLENQEKPSFHIVSQDPKNPIYSVAITPDGKTLAAGGKDGTIKVWNIENQEKPRIFPNLPDSLTLPSPIYSVAITGDGKTLAAGGKDGTIKVWNLEAVSEKPRIITDNKDVVYSVAITGDGKTLVSGSKDGTIKVWNLREKRGKPHFFTAHQMPINSVAITPDEKTLVSGSDDKTIKVWDLATGKELRTLNGHQDEVTSVALSSDGKTLVSGSRDKTIKVWDLDFNSLMVRSCDWVWAYLHNPNSDVKEEDRHLCDGIGTKQ